MSDSKENEEGGQGMPLAVEESQQLVDAEVQVQLEASSCNDTSNHVENGKAEQLSGDHEIGKAEPLAEDENVKPGKVEPPAEDSEKPGKAEPPAEDSREKLVKAEPPVEDKSVNPGETELSAEDNSVKPGKVELPAEDNSVQPAVVSGGIPREDVQNTLHSSPVEADAQISNRIECEEASNAKTKAEKLPQSNKGIESDDNTCRNNVDAAESAVDVKPEACEAADSKTCDNGDPIPSSHNNGDPIPSSHDNGDPILSSHNEPTSSQAVPANTKAEIKNELEVENKADERKADEPADNGNSNSTHISFLNADHSYDGNESGTEEEQSAFMKELENFFRERSMEFKPPKFYGEGLNCLK